MSFRFPREGRLRTRAEFVAVQERGRRVATRYITLLGLPNDRGRDRLGLIASRRLGGAVTRTRAKRRLRELFRLEESDTVADGQRALDIVAIPRRELASAPHDQLRADFRAALRKLRGATR
jgi:ribonuclease P protein component